MADKQMRGFNYTLSLKLRAGKTFFGPGVVELIQRIDRTESLSTAAKEMGMSYNKAWRIMKRAEEELGYPLIIKSVGGSNGGGSVVTKKGRELTENYLLFQQKSYEIADQFFQEIFMDKKNDG